MSIMNCILAILTVGVRESNGSTFSWLQGSLNWICTIVRRVYGDDGAEGLSQLCHQIPDMADCDKVQLAFDHANASWPILRDWVAWWNKPHVLQRLVFAYSGKSFF
jgi:hypothetical protein